MGGYCLLKIFGKAGTGITRRQMIGISLPVLSGFFLLWESEAKGIGDSLLTAFFAVIVLTGVWGSFGQETLKDLYMPYTAAKAAAETIEALPDGAVIFENSEDYCNAVIPYLKKKKIYNPFNGQVANFCDRNPEHAHYIGFDDFIAQCSERFPDAEGVYILCSVNSNYIGISDEEAEKITLCWSSYEELGETIQSEAFDIRYLKIN